MVKLWNTSPELQDRLSPQDHKHVSDTNGHGPHASQSTLPLDATSASSDMMESTANLSALSNGASDDFYGPGVVRRLAQKFAQLASSSAKPSFSGKPHDSIAESRQSGARAASFDNLLDDENNSAKSKNGFCPLFDKVRSRSQSSLPNPVHRHTFQPPNENEIRSKLSQPEVSKVARESSLESEDGVVKLRSHGSEHLVNSSSVRRTIPERNGTSGHAQNDGYRTDIVPEFVKVSQKLRPIPSLHRRPSAAYRSKSAEIDSCDTASADDHENDSKQSLPISDSTDSTNRLVFQDKPMNGHGKLSIKSSYQNDAESALFSDSNDDVTAVSNGHAYPSLKPRCKNTAFAKSLFDKDHPAIDAKPVLNNTPTLLPELNQSKPAVEHRPNLALEDEVVTLSQSIDEIARKFGALGKSRLKSTSAAGQLPLESSKSDELPKTQPQRKTLSSEYWRKKNNGGAETTTADDASFAFSSFSISDDLARDASHDHGDVTSERTEAFVSLTPESPATSEDSVESLDVGKLITNADFHDSCPVDTSCDLNSLVSCEQNILQPGMVNSPSKQSLIFENSSPEASTNSEAAKQQEINEGLLIDIAAGHLCSFEPPVNGDKTPEAIMDDLMDSIANSVIGSPNKQTNFQRPLLEDDDWLTPSDLAMDHLANGSSLTNGLARVSRSNIVAESSGHFQLELQSSQEASNVHSFSAADSSHHEDLAIEDIESYLGSYECVFENANVVVRSGSLAKRLRKKTESIRWSENHRAYAYVHENEASEDWLTGVELSAEDYKTVCQEIKDANAKRHESIMFLLENSATGLSQGLAQYTPTTLGCEDYSLGQDLLMLSSTNEEKTHDSNPIGSNCVINFAPIMSSCGSESSSDELRLSAEESSADLFNGATSLKCNSHGTENNSNASWLNSTATNAEVLLF